MWFFSESVTNIFIVNSTTGYILVAKHEGSFLTLLITRKVIWLYNVVKIRFYIEYFIYIFPFSYLIRVFTHLYIIFPSYAKNTYVLCSCDDICVSFLCFKFVKKWGSSEILGKNIVVVFLKMNKFRKLIITVISSSHNKSDFLGSTKITIVRFL